MALLEVTALDAADARAAEAGGADRVAVAADLAADGLTPDPVVVEAVRAATSLPLRVVLRANPGFGTTAPELDRLRRAAEALAAAGADGFVFGFLDRLGRVDVAATAELAAVAAPLPWTFHRALDHAADPDEAWRTAAELPGLDTVLTAGSPRTAEAGIATLLRRAAETPGSAGLLMAGGALRRKHVAPLAAAGVTSFHLGPQARPDASWHTPVDPALVHAWSTLVTAAARWDPRPKSHRSSPIVTM